MLRPVRFSGDPAAFGGSRPVAFLSSDPGMVVTVGGGGGDSFLEAPPGSTFIPLPELRPAVACHIHCVGPSGAGKSSFANLYAGSFKAQTGGRVVVLSADSEPDPALDAVDVRIRVDESLGDVQLEDLASPDGRPTLLVFDDVEGLSKPIATALRVFTQAVKERGRKMGVHSLSIYHRGAGGLTTRDSLAEASAFTVFPSKLNTNSEYMLRKYAGIPPEVIGLLRNGSWGRWLMVYPGEMLLSERRCAELDSSVLSAIAKEERKRLSRDAAATVHAGHGEESAASQLAKLSFAS